MAVYSASVSYDGAIQTPTALAQNDAPIHFIALMVKDLNTGGINEFAIRAGISVDKFGGSPTYSFLSSFELVYRVVLPFFSATGPDPFDWSPFSTPAILTDLDGSGYLGGGTLTIEKDYSADRLSMICPLGTLNRTLTEASNFSDGGALNNTPIYPFGFGMLWDLPLSDAFAPVFNPVDSDTRARLFNMYARQSGRIIFGHSLAAGDPPDITGWAEDSTDTVGNPTTTGAGYLFDLQDTNRYILERQTTVANYPRAGLPASPGLRTSVRYTTSVQSPPIESSVDMEFSPEHGLLWRAGPASFFGDTMYLTTSYDNGRNWGTFLVVYQNDGDLPNSPSLAWTGETLFLCWHTGTDIVEAHSRDLGVTWSMPTTIPFTGTNPRRIQEKHGGPAYYFYINPGGDLLVVRSADSGGSFDGPYAVATNIGAQQIDAEFDNSDDIVCSYMELGIWTQKRSRDRAVTWS